MAILDQNQNQFATWAVTVASGNPISAGQGYDLNPEFGVGPTGLTRKSSAVSQSGGDLGILVEIPSTPIDGSFVASAGTPSVAFHAVLSTSVGITFDNFVVIGSSCATVRDEGSLRFSMGYRVNELQAGAKFFIRLNPWTNGMGLLRTNATVKLEDLRYLNLIAHSINEDVATLASGLALGYLCHAADVFSNPADFVPPSSVLNVG